MEKLSGAQKGAAVAVIAVLAAGVVALGVGTATNLQQDRDRTAQCAVTGNC